LDPGDLGPAEVTCGEGSWVGGGLVAVVPPPPALDPNRDLLPIRYPAGVTHSPINLHVAQRLHALVTAHPHRDPRVFMKVGDSIPASTRFLSCVSEPRPAWAPPEVYRNLGGMALGHTLEHFCTPIGSRTAFDRTSLAAQSSELAAWATNPDPITNE